ncbi:cytidine deaminase [Acidothermaceae bacterium B102]|nr:cytidine deaminase [Acidothermaceae bacterium B102]
MPGPDETLDPEDAKILTLARVAQQRSYAPYTGVGQGAAVRDTDGRTYAAATVENADDTLTTSAVRAAVAAAVSSGARRFEAVALVSADPFLATDDVAVVAEFGGPTPVLLAALDGVLVQTVHVGAEADLT